MHHAPKTVRWLETGRYGASAHKLRMAKEAIAGHDSCRRSWPCAQSDATVVGGYIVMLYVHMHTHTQQSAGCKCLAQESDRGCRQCAHGKSCVGCVERCDSSSAHVKRDGRRRRLRVACTLMACRRLQLLVLPCHYLFHQPRRGDGSVELACLGGGRLVSPGRMNINASSSRPSYSRHDNSRRGKIPNDRESQGGRVS